MANGNPSKSGRSSTSVSDHGLEAFNEQSSLSRALTLIVLVSLITVQCILVGADRRDKLLADGPEPRLANSAQVVVVAANQSSKAIPQGQTKSASSTRFEPAPRSVSARHGGQLEAFSTDWTGLGDLEASDDLKKMNRRSSHESPLLAAASLGQGSRRLSRTKPASWDKRAQLYTLQQVEAPATADRILGPILLSRRTEGLLEPPQQQHGSTGLMDSFRGGAEDNGDTFPLLGEFGSRVSLLTTRKTEPRAGSLGAYIVAANGHRPLNVGWRSAHENENEDDDHSISSSPPVLISPQQLSSMRKSVEGALLAATEAGAQNDEAAGLRLRLSQKQPETVSIMESLSSNYLPRVARRVIM